MAPPALHIPINKPSGMQTTILISNLHCSSCVSTIQDVLSHLSPPPLSINTSIVSQTVSVEHEQGLDPQVIKDALDEAGFDLVTTPVLDSYKLRRFSQSHSMSSRKKEKHAEQCSLCKQEAAGYTVSDVTLATAKDAALKSPSSSNAFKQAAGEKVVGDEDQGYLVSFSVGGMTCSACTGTITNLTSEIDGVSDVVVNLVGKSATAKFKRREIINQFVEIVEDAGYECEMVNMEPIKDFDPTNKESEPVTERTISLRVDGMFCKHCPEKLMKALEPYMSSITVHEPLPSHTDKDPILRLTYHPSPPDFTIRTIMAALASSKSPPFEVTIAHPPSLEERARIIHTREQHRLLNRFLSSLIIAIPTFIIGIVYMSLVPSTNASRQYLMEPMWTGNTSRAQWAMFFLATPVMFYSAGLFHVRSIKELRFLWRKGSKTPIWKRFVKFGSMNLLVSMGVSIAYFSSIALLALAAQQPRSPTGIGDTTTYFDSVVFLSMFLLAGRYLEAYSKHRTADAITALSKLRPSEALLVVSNSSNDTPNIDKTERDLEKSEADSVSEAIHDLKPGFHIQKINVDLLEVGDVVRVLHGASPPADGTIASNEGSQFDESSLTGESRPIKKLMGDSVFVGTINEGKVVDVRIAAIGGETMLDQIVKVVRQGQTKRAPIERVADIVTGYFVPVITFLAVLTWIIWLSLGFSGRLPASYLDIPTGGWTVWSLEFAIAVFVVACPCGVGLAAPTALLVGSGLAAKFGILVRGGGEAFQEAAQLDVMVFDKTGTLTQGGEPLVTDTKFDDENSSWDRDSILAIASELESASSHPLGTAVRRYCEDGGKKSVSSESIEEIGGKGLKGIFENPKCTAVIGNEAWMADNGASISVEQQDTLRSWKEEGKSVILLALRDDNPNAHSDIFKIVALMAVSDPVRPESRTVIEHLQQQGLSTWMISGDNEITARAVAKTVGIPETNVIAGVLPHQKAEKIAWLQQVGPKRPSSGFTKFFIKKRLNERCIVAMVGDGINDAPALTTADVGLAIGSGSDVAISSASFILVQSDLYTILTLVDLSRKVFRRVKFNFFWAFIYNTIALPIAAGVIYPAGNARLNPVWASLAMALSSVTVVVSSLFLRLYRPPRASKNMQMK